MYPIGLYNSPYPTPLPTPTYELSTLSCSDIDITLDSKQDKLKTQTHDLRHRTELKRGESYEAFPIVGLINANPNSLVVPVPHKPEVKSYQSNCGTPTNTILPSQIKTLQQTSLQDSLTSTKEEDKKPCLNNLDSSLLHSLGKP